METIKLSFRVRNIAILILLISFSSCISISSFDQYIYTQTTSVKVDALSVMDLAKEDYNIHKEKVAELQINLQKIYEYEKNRPNNDITIKLWDKLLNAEGHLLAGFIKRWEAEKKLSETFIKEAKKQTADAFDIIAGLESKKIKRSDI